MDIFQPKPDCFDAWLTIAFAGQEAADAGDLSQDIVEARLGRRRLCSQQIGSLNLVRVEEQRGIQVGTGAAKPHQMGDAPGHHEVQCQGAFNAFDSAQLQRLDPAGILEYVKQDLDFPPCAVPVDQLGGVRRRVGAAIGQQPSFDRFLTSRGVVFACHDAGRAHALASSRRQFDAARPQLLARLGHASCR